MNEIVNKLILAEKIKRLDILAPEISRRAVAGQFVNVTPTNKDESIPLTIIQTDRERGTISLIVHERGDTTSKLAALGIRESVYCVQGPLGMPAAIPKVGNVVCIATGIGVAQMLPICRAFKKDGNKVIGIIGAENKKKLLLEAQMRLSCHKIFITTQDGSYERRGLATDLLKKLMNEMEINYVYAIGAPEMMQAVCALTKEKNIPTRVQLNPIMLDCLGLCAACRVKVGNDIKLACIDGPEFDGHKVDFEDYITRLKVSDNQSWNSKKVSISPKTNESSIFKRFLLAIPKK